MDWISERMWNFIFREHYTWPVIEQKYLDTLKQLQQEDQAGVNRRLEPMPGWLQRHRRRLSPAIDILKTAPAGPVIYKGDSPKQQISAKSFALDRD